MSCIENVEHTLLIFNQETWNNFQIAVRDLVLSICKAEPGSGQGKTGHWVLGI